jgi:hypothetical protein
MGCMFSKISKKNKDSDSSTSKSNKTENNLGKTAQNAKKFEFDENVIIESRNDAG